jgi:hypothetical protein
MHGEHNLPGDFFAEDFSTGAKRPIAPVFTIPKEICGMAHRPGRAAIAKSVTVPT